MALPRLESSKKTRVIAVTLLLLAILAFLNRDTAIFTTPEPPITIVIESVSADGYIESDGIGQYRRFDANASIRLGTADFGEKARGYFDFNLSKLPPDATILSVNATLNVESPSGDTFCQVEPLEGSSADYADNNIENNGFYDDLANGIPYVRISDFCKRTGTRTLQLSRSAGRDLQKQLSRAAIFGFGVITVEDGGGPQALITSSESPQAGLRPKITVTYTGGTSSAIGTVALAALAALGALAAAIAYGISRARKHERHGVESQQPKKPLLLPPGSPPAKTPEKREQGPVAEAKHGPKPAERPAAQEPARPKAKERKPEGGQKPPRLLESLKVLRRYGKTRDSRKDDEEKEQEIVIFEGDDDKSTQARDEMKKVDLLLSNYKRTRAASKEIDDAEDLLAEARKLLREGNSSKALFKAKQASRLLEV